MKTNRERSFTEEQVGCVIRALGLIRTDRAELTNAFGSYRVFLLFVVFIFESF